MPASKRWPGTATATWSLAASGSSPGSSLRDEGGRSDRSHDLERRARSRIGRERRLRAGRRGPDRRTGRHLAQRRPARSSSSTARPASHRWTHLEAAETPGVASSVVVAANGDVLAAGRPRRGLRARLCRARAERRHRRNAMENRLPPAVPALGVEARDLVLDDAARWCRRRPSNRPCSGRTSPWCRSTQRDGRDDGRVLLPAQLWPGAPDAERPEAGERGHPAAMILTTVDGTITDRDEASQTSEDRRRPGDRARRARAPSLASAALRPDRDRARSARPCRSHRRAHRAAPFLDPCDEPRSAREHDADRILFPSPVATTKPPLGSGCARARSAPRAVAERGGGLLRLTWSPPRQEARPSFATATFRARLRRGERDRRRRGLRQHHALHARVVRTARSGATSSTKRAARVVAVVSRQTPGADPLVIRLPAAARCR